MKLNKSGENYLICNCVVPLRKEYLKPYVATVARLHISKNLVQMGNITEAI